MERTARWHLTDRRRNILYACLLLAYIAFNLSFLVCHENWRDEAQAWLLARELSIPELFAQMSYEGHPCLWHLLLMPLAKLGLPYVSMNILSLTIMSVAAALFLWKSPLPLPMKALALFGIGFSYYYPVISRSYCLIPLFVFMMACFYPARREKPLRYGLAIALLVQTHIIMLGMAAAASLVWLCEAIAGYRRDRERRALLLQGAGLALPLLSFILLLLQISSPQRSTAYRFTMDKVLTLPRRAIGAIRKLIGYFPTPVGIALLLLAAGVCVWLLIRALRGREFAMLKPLLITVCAVAWQYAVHVLIRASAAIRTLSIVFILLWFFWVSWKSVGDKLLLRLMAVALVVMELVTYTPYSGALNEYRHLYSGAKNCAAFIREELPSDTIFLEVNVARGSSLLPYLSEDYVFYEPHSGEPATFATWDRAIYDRMELRGYEDICQWARALDPDCEFVCFIITPTDGALEDGLIEAMEPYLSDDALLYRTPDGPMATNERYSLYAIPVA